MLIDVVRHTDVPAEVFNIFYDFFYSPVIYVQNIRFFDQKKKYEEPTKHYKRLFIDREILRELNLQSKLSPSYKIVVFLLLSLRVLFERITVFEKKKKKLRAEEGRRKRKWIRINSLALAA